MGSSWLYVTSWLYIISPSSTVVSFSVKRIKQQLSYSVIAANTIVVSTPSLSKW